MNWPDYFPENCPPKTAEEAAIQVYRLVNNDPPNEDDFMSWREQHPNDICPKGVSECQACGISVFTSLEDVNRARQKVKRLRNKKIAVANLTPNLGRILNTPSRNTGQSHCTWWLPIGVTPWNVFNVFDVIE